MFPESKPSKRVLITGAAGQIGYSLIPLVASGAVCGTDTPVDLVLLDIPQALDSLKGVVLEIEDGAYPLLRSITATADLTEAFRGTQIALMVGGFPRLPGMDRKDLLTKNAQIYVAAGKALNEVGDRNCKVLVVANPANTNCYIMKDNCPNIPAENFSCLTRLDHNRAVYQLAHKLGLPSGDVGRVIIWGNHSNTQVPDISHAVGRGSNNAAAPAVSLLNKKLGDTAAAEWIEKDFTPVVSNRGAAVLAARQKSSAMSAANAIADHVRNWLSPVASDKHRDGDWVSMGIVSQGWYGVEKGLIFSFPVVVSEGKITVVENLNHSDRIKELIKKTEAELIAERDIYLQIKKETAAANV